MSVPVVIISAALLYYWELFISAVQARHLRFDQLIMEGFFLFYFGWADRGIIVTLAGLQMLSIGFGEGQKNC